MYDLQFKEQNYGRNNEGGINHELRILYLSLQLLESTLDRIPNSGVIMNELRVRAGLVAVACRVVAEADGRSVPGLTD